MTDKIKLSGLCINCLNSDDCIYRLNHTNPIIFCEEFSCTDPSEPKTTIERPLKNNTSEDIPQVKGLCSNCENFETCTLQNKGAFVINCEEYR